VSEESLFWQTEKDLGALELEMLIFEAVSLAPQYVLDPSKCRLDRKLHKQRRTGAGYVARQSAAREPERFTEPI
jgi:hypothetical protein